jgi:hypothetical protein
LLCIFWVFTSHLFSKCERFHLREKSLWQLNQQIFIINALELGVNDVFCLVCCVLWMIRIGCRSRSIHCRCSHWSCQDSIHHWKQKHWRCVICTPSFLFYIYIHTDILSHSLSSGITKISRIQSDNNTKHGICCCHELWPQL